MDSIKLRELRICGFGFQWGHDFSAMDSTEERDMYSEDEDTFQWGHDFSAMDSQGGGKITIIRDEAGFNGATTFQPWIEIRWGS